MANKVRAGGAIKVSLHTCIKNEQYDWLVRLAQTTKSRTQYELLSLALHKFLAAKPWLTKSGNPKQDWWEPSESYHVGRPPNRTTNPNWRAFNTAVTDITGEDGETIEALALTKALEDVATQYCQKTGIKTGGAPNMQRASYNFIRWTCDDLFPKSKYSDLVPKFEPAARIKLTKAETALLPALPLKIPASKRVQIIKPNPEGISVTMTIKLTEPQRLKWNKLGGAEWARTTLESELDRMIEEEAATKKTSKKKAVKA